jgi:predicted MFS family arabinose efflux permease
LIALRFPAVRGDGGSTLSAQASLLLRARFLAHLALSGVLFAAMFAAYTYIAPLLEAVSSLDGAMVGWMLMGFGVAGIVGNGIAGHVVGRDPTLAAAIGAAILALAMATVAFAGAHPIGTVIVVGVWGAAHTAAFVFCQVGAIAAGRDVPAFAVSLNISICNLGIAIGAVAGGAIVDRFGAGAAGYAGAMIALAALAVAVLILGSRPRAAAKA